MAIMAIMAIMACASGPSVNGRVAAGASRETFRVLEWNVSDSDWVKQRAASRAVLRHADPDVFVLVQVAGDLRPSDIRQMLAGLRGAGDTTWFLSYRPTGSSEHAVIASRDSVRDLPEFALVSLPRTGAAALLATPPDTGARPSPRDTGDTVRTNGAMVRVGSRWLMVVGVHLTCCGTAATWREFRRQLGAAEIRDRMRAAIERSVPRGVIVAGDMNLVSGRAPLDTILGLVTVPRLGAVQRADAVREDGRTDWTWDGRGTPFEAGRLDNIAYSSAALAVVRGRVWDTESMAPETLSVHGLTAATSRSINRHRPVVVDFRFVP
jgi:hypothetical protein